MVMTCRGFSHRCARTQEAVPNMQTLFKSLLAFVHSDWKNPFSQSPQYGNRNTDVSGQLTEIYGAASGLLASIEGNSCITELHTIAMKLQWQLLLMVLHHAFSAVTSQPGNKQLIFVMHSSIYQVNFPLHNPHY